jgi:nucleoside-diphosphate-sugar epimerase
MASVFITGASGFMGRRLSAELVARGHSVRGLVRRGSEKHVAIGCEGVTGDPLDASTYQKFVAGCDTLVHLVGVEQMIAGMARAIADPPNGVRVWEVPEIRFMGT